MDTEKKNDVISYVFPAFRQKCI